MSKPIYFIGFIFISLALIGGQLLRLSWGGVAITALDIMVMAWGAIWLIDLAVKRRRYPIPRFMLWAVLFVLLAIVSLIGALRWLNPIEVATAAIYLVRWVGYALLVYMGYNLARSRQLFIALGIIFAVVSALGIIQWWLLPDLRFLEQFGWDPHQGRLVSTFLDPNFVGGFLAIGLALAVPQLMTSPTKKLRWYWGVVLALTLIGVYFTFSRSGLLALLAVIGVLGALRYRLLSAILLTIVVLGCLASPRWVERSKGAVTVDQTAQYRIESWVAGINIIRQEPIIGVGFNTLPSTRSRYGASVSGHSASGFDSSLLTVGTTTGGLGLLAYLGLLTSSLLLAWRKWRKASSPIALSFLAATTALLAHSIFVNSLLYPSVLVVWWIILGLVWAA